MFAALAKRVFGSANDRFIKGLREDGPGDQRPGARAQEADRRRAGRPHRAGCATRLAKGETLDDLLPDAFATVREAAERTLGQRHFDVQLMGGMVLHQGKIAEMKTGEGKTLVATLPVYLNALEGKGVHVVTVNDYLARRDAEWMGQIYRFLGLTVGVIVHGLERRRAPRRLRLRHHLRHQQRVRLRLSARQHEVPPGGHGPAATSTTRIVDEVDSILIDEARTPLIISGPTEDNSELYAKVDKLIPHLKSRRTTRRTRRPAHVTLTEDGTEHIEKLLTGVRPAEARARSTTSQNVALVHHVNQALRAHKLFARDVDYIVKDDKVVIIDEFTGRMMEGRRYSEGLHQALEAKEGVADPEREPDPRLDHLPELFPPLSRSSPA